MVSARLDEDAEEALGVVCDDHDICIPQGTAISDERRWNHGRCYLMETLRFIMVTTHYPPQGFGGDAIMVKYLSTELAARGHEVQVFFNPGVYESLRRDGTAGEKYADHRGIIRHAYSTRTKRLSLLAAYSLGMSGRAQDRLTKLCRESRPDVVHWHNTKGFIGRPFSIPGSTNLYTPHDYYAVCPRNNLRRNDSFLCTEPRGCQLCLLRSARIPQLWRVGGRRVVRIPDDTRIIPPSEFMARRLKADGLTIHSVIRNFVPEVDEKRRNRNRDCTRLAYVGIMEPHKGPSTLLEAFASSRKRHRFHLSLIGDGSLRNRLVDRVARLGLEERVWVPGHLSKSDLDSALDATSLLVVPSEWYENSPLTVLEAFACGIPVLGSNLGGLPEILDRESGAMVFSAGDVDNLASRLVEIWDTRDQLSEMGMKARSAYERRFTPQAYIAQYMKAIDTM